MKKKEINFDTSKQMGCYLILILYLIQNIISLHACHLTSLKICKQKLETYLIRVLLLSGEEKEKVFGFHLRDLIEFKIFGKLAL